MLPKTHQCEDISFHILLLNLVREQGLHDGSYETSCFNYIIASINGVM